MDFLTTTEAAKKWNISARRVAILCEEGRVPGSFKKGKTWLIPSSSIKPEDERFKKEKKQDKESK